MKMSVRAASSVAGNGWMASTKKQVLRARASERVLCVVSLLS